MMRNFISILTILTFFVGLAQKQKDAAWDRKFEQLGTVLPTPNTYRTASGAPGKDYWQQRADYKMKIILDDENQSITGSEEITYYNNSPDDLEYLWLQLDQNLRSKNSDTPLIKTSTMDKSLTVFDVYNLTGNPNYEGGFKIASVKSAGKDIDYVINKTMMRLDLEQPLKSGENISFSVDWSYDINKYMEDDGRSGYEYFEEEDNYLYAIAQFFPRMAVYIDNEGWQHKQFLGDGEFALNFGNYEFELTVPSDFVVAATGTLQNPKEVLTTEQIRRLELAKSTFDKPVMVIDEAEAIENERMKATGSKTWKFYAKDVRDFAFAASRKFIWEVMAVELSENNKPLAMSYYPKEGNPLWEELSTMAVASALKTYSKYTIEYPYPKAISVHAAGQGMEYPMICFNRGRPLPDGSYSLLTKIDMIGVIIHEIGHNFFPMIINSDERQWTWMDEGLNTFVEYLAHQEFIPGFPSDRGPANTITAYMSGESGLVRPVMINSEQIRQFGNNAYGKPAAALNILRTVVMGPELFDKALKTYSERWAFKHPTPADFFRTMEDASAFDLDWFWKGWFYGTDNVDISLDNVRWFKMKTEENNLETKNITGAGQAIDGSTKQSKDFSQRPELFEFEAYNFHPGDFRETPANTRVKEHAANRNFYELTFKNEGGLVSPVLIEWTYADGTKELDKIPAEIWKIDEKEVSKVFVKEKEVTKITIDPNELTADTNTANNIFPRSENLDRIEKFKSGN